MVESDALRSGHTRQLKLYQAVSALFGLVSVEFMSGTTGVRCEFTVRTHWANRAVGGAGRRAWKKSGRAPARRWRMEKNANPMCGSIKQ